MKKFLNLIIVISICLSFCGCNSEKNNNMTFVTSCYPIYIMTINLTDGIENVKVSNMTENHKGCLHDFQIQSKDLKQIEKSSAFIINGAGMEIFLDQIMDKLYTTKVIDSSKNINLITEHSDHHCEDEHCHHEYNSHTWLSINNYIKQVENIKDGLVDIDPDHKEQYQKNAENYIKKLGELKNEMHLSLDNIKNKNIVTFHEAFPYFAKEFGLNIAAVISHEPENDPSAKELAETIEIVKKSNINALFVEPQYPSKAAEVISQETGAEIYTLDPAVTGDNSKNSYLDTMRKNMETLKTALN